jgi:hypothetical protein
MKWLMVVMMISAPALLAGDRFEIVPSLLLQGVTDNNLNASFDDPISDRITRVTPALTLRLDSSRLRIAGGYSLDSERYMTHSSFDSNRARERAELGIAFDATPRLILALNGSYVDTNTLTDLNADTALAGSRARGRRFTFGPSANIRLSPQTTAAISASSSSTNVVNGVGMRVENEDARLDRWTTSRDRLSLAYTHNRLMFSGAAGQTVDTHVMIGEWIHHFSARDRLMLQAGPRVTGSSRSLDAAGSFTHTFRITSIGLVFSRSQATLIGYAGTVQAESLLGHFSFDPNRRLSLYMNPAVFRSTHGNLTGTVTRAAFGARWAIASLLDADVSYNRDLQKGAIDTFRGDEQLSHSTISIGLSTRWSNRQRAR